MPKKINYAALFTLRSDGRYMTYIRTRDGKRRAVYDRDPQRLYERVTAPEPLPVFEDYAERWYEAHAARVSFKTAEAYAAPLRRLEGHFAGRDLAEITAADVSAYLAELGKKKYARRTVQMHRDVLNMIFNYAILAGDLAANPCAAVAMPKNLTVTRRELPEDAAIRAVLDNAAVPFGLFALVCLTAGLRRGEALALRYEDIDRAAGVIHVTKAVEFIGNSPQLKPTKTAAGERDAILPAVLAAAIPATGSGYLFPRDDGGLLTKTQYRKRWLAYCRAIGYDITAHQLRHGFATLLYEAEIPDKDAQDLLGHASISTTRNIYTHIRSTRRAATAEKFNAFLSDNNFDNR